MTDHEPTDLHALRRIESAMTPAPWQQALHIREPCALTTEADPHRSLLAVDRDGMGILDRKEDAAGIVALRNHAAAVFEELVELRRFVAGLAAIEPEAIPPGMVLKQGTYHCPSCQIYSIDGNVHGEACAAERARSLCSHYKFGGV